MVKDWKVEAVVGMNKTRAYSVLDKPEGKMGILAARHAGIRPKTVAWGFEDADLDWDSNILEVGFGAGYLIQILGRTMREKKGSGKVHGIDHSQTMVEEASRRNERLIKEGFVELSQGDVLEMPFADESFSAVITIETVNFWKALPKGFKEVYRVLKPGGKFLALENFFKNGMEEREISELESKMKWFLHHVSEFKAFLKDAGFKIEKAIISQVEDAFSLKLLSIK